MGLSASQARFLNLTARMHDIEYKAQNLEAQKLQMANESTQVYQEYENALNKQKVQFKQIGSDGSANYIDASLQTLLDANYKIKILSGSTWYNYDADATNKWQSSVVETVTCPAITGVNKAVGATVTASNGKTYVLTAEAAVGATTITGRALPSDKEAEGLGKLKFDSEETLRNLVEAGFIIFEKPTTDKNGDTVYSEVNIATDTSLQEVSDETELKKAEAKYEADMRKINQKDKKFDTDLAAMDAERNAIKTEMDTLKTVAKENVDRTFKLFS